MAASDAVVKAPPSSQNQGSPGHTIYCKNLNDKLKKQDLRRNLYALFSAYGPLLDVVALRGVKNKGQAHIVFRDIPSAQAAMRGLQGFPFFGREVRLEWARNKSRKVIEMARIEPSLITTTAIGSEESSMQVNGSSHAILDSKSRLKKELTSEKESEMDVEEEEDQSSSVPTKRPLEPQTGGEPVERISKRTHAS